MKLSLYISKLLTYFFLSFYGIFLHAETAYPVDISYMVADFKYNKENGLKICEVQHGVVSATKGDLYVAGGDGTIFPKITDFFDGFPIEKWVAGPVYPPLKNFLKDKKWKYYPFFNAFKNESSFLEKALCIPEDFTSIDCYHAMVYATFDILRNFNFLRETYPGVLFIDAATLPYWIDKYKMNVLFNKNEELKKYKAEWQLYPKKYDIFLAEKIQREIPSDFYVIKPRTEFLGNGVIVVEAKDLDATLHLILEPKESLKQHSEKNYSYWAKNKSDTFLIEKYYPSDYLHFEHSLKQKKDACILEKGGNYRYDATMRIAFILKYDKGKSTYHSLGGFWKLPCKALEEEGTLNEKRISFCAPPFYRAVDPELLKEIDQELEKAMLLLYEQMLHPET